MSKSIIDISVSSHFLKSQRNSNLTAPEGISELVDNSLDAGARNIEITITPEELSVTDNGAGCADIQCMAAVGVHRKSPTTKLGRYGVGLKNCAQALGRYLSIQTQRDGVLRRTKIDWELIETSGKWETVVEEDPIADNQGGTRILIGGLFRSAVPFRVKSAISKTFAPAIWDGVTITVDGEEVDPWRMPEMSNVIEAEEWLDDATGFSVRAGIVQRNDREPFIFAYQHRIVAESSAPCGDYSTSSQFCAFVTLHGEWSLAKHKDSLTSDGQSAWLNNRLNYICGPLLKRLHEIGESVALDQMSSELEQAICSAFGIARRPGRGGSKRDESGQQIDRKVTEAEVVSELGDVRQRNGGKAKLNMRGFSMRYDEMEPGKLGKVDVNERRACIRLNILHPTIAALKNRTAPDARHSLKTIAATLLARHQADNTDRLQQVFPFADEMDDKFQAILSPILEKITSDELSKRDAGICEVSR